MKTYDNNDSVKKASTKGSNNILVRAILRLFKNCTQALELKLPNGNVVILGQNEVTAKLTLNSWRALSRLLLGGQNAWAKSYIDGQWYSEDLTAFIRWGISQEHNFSAMEKISVLAGVADNFYHWRRDNSRKGSKENIAAHYDLGNDFYRHWLDSTMSYSSALFEYQGQPLVDAQRNKNNQILQLLAANENDSVLEIGCGWGGFATQAHATKGLKVTGITLSEEQLSWANNRLSDSAMAKKLSFSLTDYRDVNAQYDAVVSIEMFEAVGESHWDEYFQTLRKVLKSKGVAVLQIITIEDERFLEYRKKADFIQRYVFPGGMLPSVKVLHEKFKEHGFELEQEQFFGKDYATTLTHWKSEFDNNWDKLESLGFDEPFKRLWHYYLGYCEGGFLENSIDVGMFKIRKI